MSAGAFLVAELEKTERRRHPPLTADAPYRENAKERAAFERVRRAERQFAVQLRKIARHIGDIVSTFQVDDPQQIDQMTEMLNRYSLLIRPWARSVSRRLLAEVGRRDAVAWKRYSRLMGAEIKREIEEAPTGHVFQKLMEEQVTLITSLPTDAANRVHQIVTGNLYEGARAGEVATEIMRTGKVTQARADLIARTETARAASSFMQARAEHIGSTHYIWRTSKDRRVRPSHRKLEGKVIAWNDPPECDPPHRAHAGMIWNCRCFPEPIIPVD